MAKTATLRTLRPAPPRHVTLPPMIAPRITCFYDLPAELRIEIYRLVLEKVTIFILPQPRPLHHPHSLVRTSRQVRNEVLPLLHAHARISAKVTDFDFRGMLEWMRRIPPEQESNLCKNNRLTIELRFSPTEAKGSTSNSLKNAAVLKRWLHMRADPYRPHPKWTYHGLCQDRQTLTDMRKKSRRATGRVETLEFNRMLSATGILSGLFDEDGFTRDRNG